MQQGYHFYILDDDDVFLKLISRFLEPIARQITTCTSSLKALEEISTVMPDCVLLDMMMPELDGLEVLKQLRDDSRLRNLKIIVVSGKSYEFDRKRAFEFGADGYITKPVAPDNLVQRLKNVLEDKVQMIFWGVRGTLPVPGSHSVRYGGNTSCVSLEFPKGNLFIFDAGTGIKSLSDALMEQKKALINSKIFISHPHWDHINALPFFAPLFIQGNSIEICGPAHGDITVRDLISGQMDGVYFPINIKEFSAHVDYRDLKEELLTVEGVEVRTMLLNHPGTCLGYRVTYKDRSLCYITDNELYPPDTAFYNEYYRKQLTAFIHSADGLIIDTTYTENEYPSKIGWGHSPVDQVVELAHAGDIGTLYLFHHDPGQSDDDIDRKLARAQQLLEEKGSTTTCIAPVEKEVFRL